MKLRDAETLLRLQKEQGPITEYWSALTDEGILLEAWPLGFAHGAWGLRDLVTARGGVKYSALFEGEGVPRYVTQPGPHRLWQQELFVYLRELQEAVGNAVKDIDNAPLFPRVGEYEDGKTAASAGAEPEPEDFHLFAAPRVVRWHLQGKQDISDGELALVKDEFCALLALYTGEKYAKRKAVRICSALSPETYESTNRTWGESQVGTVSSLDSDDWE